MTETHAEPVGKIAADGRINIVSPLDGRVVDRIPGTKVLDLPDIASRARGAQQAWAAVPLKQRVRAVSGLAKGLGQAADDLVEALRVEVGRHPTESWFAEIVPNIDLVKWWCGPGRKHLADQKIGLNPINFPGKRARIEMVPRGVLGLITPWNYPVSIPLRALVPALLAGNAVLWKPSEYSAYVSEKLMEVLNGVVPEDLVQLVQGDGRVGAGVIEHVDGIGFTGSLHTGQTIARRAAERMIPSSLELGGKDFAVVMPDADLKRAAAGIAWAALTNAGQNCASVEVVAVHESIAPRFAEFLREEVKSMAPYVGPVINDQQKVKVSRQLEDAVGKGALIMEGGLSSPEGLRIEPTLIERAPLESTLIREETFGPVVPMVTFASTDEIRQRLDDCDFGLTLSVWTRDIPAARNWTRHAPVGVITFNNHSFTAGIAAMPWTGVKGSGLGVTNSHFALEWMVRPQGVLEDRSRQREPWWHPFNDAALQLAQSITRLNAGIGSPFSAIKGLLGGFIRRWK